MMVLSSITMFGLLLRTARQDDVDLS
jgi:hypothetical protein